MSHIEKQIFCADANICAVIAKCNSQNKWELWGLRDVLETGEAKYETRLLSENEYDAVEPINTTSGHTHIRLLQNNNWHEVVLIEHKKATDKPIEPEWITYSSNPPLLKLSFNYEDENESIESLLERGAGKNQTVLIDQINIADFHCSKGGGKRMLHMVDYFSTNGIDVNAKDEWGETVLMAAAKYGNADIVSLLLQNGAKINDKDNYGRTALMYACSVLNIDVVRLLLANGADADSECFLDVFGQWDISEDEIQIQIELSKLLLDKNIDVNIKGNGKTALMLIVQRSDYNDSILFLETQIELLQLILDSGADINAKDNDGKTALIYAIESKNKSVAEYLLQQGADINIKDSAGNTALMCIIKLEYRKYHPDDFRLFLETQTELLQLFLDSGADVNVKDNAGNTALMCIVKLEYTNYSEYKDWDYEDTILFKLFLENQTELLQLILDSGADINAKDDDGKTALMLAIESKNKSVAEYLLHKVLI